MSSSDRFATSSSSGRNAVIVGSVVAFHAAAIWAVQHGMTHAPEPQIIPATVIAEFIAPPAPAPQPPAPPPPAPPAPLTPAPPPKPAPKPVPKPKPKPVPKPLPKAIEDPTPAPNAPVGEVESAKEVVPETPAAPPAPPAAPAAAPGPAVVLPSSNAAYLNNPRPTYPAVSRRMNEQGKVVLRVFIDENGQPQQIELNKSSGFDRLDQAAIQAVKRWKFVPGKRNGVPEGMWNIVPINFVLD